MPTLGQLLVNDLFPAEHKTTEQLNTGTLTKRLVAMAKADPRSYVQTVSKLKKLGDELSTLEGVSVGIEDIAPVYDVRDKILKPAVDKVKRAKTDAEREKVILEMQDRLVEHAATHPGSMTAMAKSKARGNVPQLMKTIASPVAAVDASGRIVPWLIGKSYAEGLSAADYWVTGNEARINTVKSATSVSEPGDVGKILHNTLYALLITKDDCGTHNGVALPTADSHILGRYLSKAQHGHPYNELVTAAVAASLRKAADKVFVRSPMTCGLSEGICKKCQGIDEKGMPHQVGINVGVRAAQALTEPLTQIALDAKHAKRLLKGASKNLGGMAGIRQLVEVPQSFFNKATLAEHPGKITEIRPAAHGGHYVFVDKTEHYVPPNLEVTVKVGQTVEAGDTLCDGVPKPDELVKHKGLGAGREYLVNSLHGLYSDAGANLDRRHIELLARADLNYLKVTDHSDAHPDLVKGDIVSYDKYRDIAARDAEEISVDKAEGHILGKEIMHFTAGTPITGSVVATLKHNGVTKVSVSKSAPRVEFLMKPITRNPLLNPDWMARLAHRYLKESLMKGAHTADVSNIHGMHPIPAYAFGSEFGLGPEGRY